VEVSMTTPQALDAVAALAHASDPGATLIGAGTVLGADNARDAVAAGARMLVSPILEQEVIEVAREHDVAVVPGCHTPTEMVHALRWGATAVKIFPAHTWTPAALRGLLEALPDLPCVPTGGVSPETAADWISAGALAVGIGSGLTAASDPAAEVARLRERIDAVDGRRG